MQLKSTVMKTKPRGEAEKKRQQANMDRRVDDGGVVRNVDLLISTDGLLSQLPASFPKATPTLDATFSSWCFSRLEILASILVPSDFPSSFQ